MKADMEFLKEDGQVGDCVRASVATLLGLPREQVPHFVLDHAGAWREALADWLETRGMLLLSFDPRWRPSCRFLACGPTGRPGGDHPAAHMVVMEGGNVYHDPHPSRSGIITVDRVDLIFPREMSAWARIDGLLERIEKLESRRGLSANEADVLLMMTPIGARSR